MIDDDDPQFILYVNALHKLLPHLSDPKRRSAHDAGLAEEEDLEKRLENMDVYLSTRAQFGPKKIWSERLEADLMRASMWRQASQFYYLNALLCQTEL